jgi:tRNA (guanine37-N1)-methyltransferase
MARPVAPQLTVTVLTAFPRYLKEPFSQGMLGRAQASGRVRLQVVDLRTFAPDRHRTLDDTPYGGGAGMLLLALPVLWALDAVAGRGPGVTRILLAPDGEPFGQDMAHELSRQRHLVLVCGRYEGVDERVRRHVDQVVSLGDFVLMGGEAAAWAVAEAVVRLVPGVVESRSLEEESFRDGLLEAPQYTRPPALPHPWGKDAQDHVPWVLRSGDHGRVRQARRRSALAKTLVSRPDLLAQAPLGPEDSVPLGEVLVAAGQGEEWDPDGLPARVLY